MYIDSIHQDVKNIFELNWKGYLSVSSICILQLIGGFLNILTLLPFLSMQWEINEERQIENAT